MKASVGIVLAAVVAVAMIRGKDWLARACGRRQCTTTYRRWCTGGQRATGKMSEKV